jgi:hypothetical protein
MTGGAPLDLIGGVRLDIGIKQRREIIADCLHAIDHCQQNAKSYKDGGVAGPPDKKVNHHSSEIWQKNRAGHSNQA